MNKIDEIKKTIEREAGHVPTSHRTDKYFSPIYHCSKSLRKLKRRYVSAYKFKFGISMQDIRLNSDVIKFINIHNELKINRSCSSLKFIKDKTTKVKKSKNAKITGKV